MLDKEKIKSIIDVVAEDSSYLEEIIDNVVKSYTESLDEIMKEVQIHIIEDDNPSIDVLEKYFLELSNAMYFMSEKVEKLALYDGVSKATAQEIYNKNIIEGQNTPKADGKKMTVGENQAIAENESIHESMVNNIYNNAYKIVKNKLTTAQTMTATLSKIITRRMTDTTFATVTSGTQRKVLNEDVF